MQRQEVIKSVIDSAEFINGDIINSINKSYWKHLTNGERWISHSYIRLRYKCVDLDKYNTLHTLEEGLLAYSVRGSAPRGR